MCTTKGVVCITPTPAAVLPAGRLAAVGRILGLVGCSLAVPDRSQALLGRSFAAGAHTLAVGLVDEGHWVEGALPPDPAGSTGSAAGSRDAAAAAAAAAVAVAGPAGAGVAAGSPAIPAEADGTGTPTCPLRPASNSKRRCEAAPMYWQTCSDDARVGGLSPVPLRTQLSLPFKQEPVICQFATPHNSAGGPG